MASYSIAIGAKSVEDKALVASTADTVTIACEPEDEVLVDVLTDGSAKVYVSPNLGTATPGAAFTVEIPAETGVPQTVRVAMKDYGLGSVALSLVSTGTPTYSVTRVGPQP